MLHIKLVVPGINQALFVVYVELETFAIEQIGPFPYSSIENWILWPRPVHSSTEFRFIWIAYLEISKSNGEQVRSRLVQSGQDGRVNDGR